MRLRWLTLLAVTGCLALSSCRDSSRPRVATASPPVTSAQVYDRMSAAMTQPDAVFYTVIQSNTTEGPQAHTRRSEIWLDLPAKRARSEIDVAFGAGPVRHATWLIDGRLWYRAQDGEAAGKREARVCHGAPDAAVSLLLDCRGSPEQSTTSVESLLTFDGRPALALVTSGGARGGGEVASFVDHVYVDRETYLPIAFTSDGTIDDNVTSVQTHTVARYDNGFVSSAALAADFFQPLSAGYVERQAPTLPIFEDAGVTAVWAGPTFVPEPSLPALSLRAAKAIPGDEVPLLGYRAYIEYGPADDEFAPPQITLREWRRDEWEQAGIGATVAAWTGGACVRRSDIALSAGTASIFSERKPASFGNAAGAASEACPGGAPDRFIAEVHIGETVVLIEALPGSAYDSESGLRVAARALESTAP